MVIAMFFIVILSFLAMQIYATGRRMPGYFSAFLLTQEAITAGRMSIDDAIQFFGHQPGAYFSDNHPNDGYYAVAPTFNPINLDWDLSGSSANKVRTVSQTANTAFTIRYAFVRGCFTNGAVSTTICHLRSLGGNRYELPMLIAARISFIRKNTTTYVYHDYFTHFIFRLPG